MKPAGGEVSGETCDVVGHNVLWTDLWILWVNGPTEPGHRAGRRSRRRHVRAGSRSTPGQPRPARVGIAWVTPCLSMGPFRSGSAPESTSGDIKGPNLRGQPGWLPPGSPSSVDQPAPPRRAEISTVPAPSSVSTGRARASSASAEAPFMAISQPPRRTSGSDQRASRGSGATAREVTTSKTRPRAAPRRGRAAPPRSSGRGPRTASSRNAVRRSNGSTRVIRRSGRAMASTSAGQPGPAPDVAHGHLARDRLAEHRAVQQVPLPEPGVSRGPISPRTTPSSARRSANFSASGRASANTPRASAGAGGAGGVSRETSLTACAAASTGEDHDVPARLDSLGLRGQAGRGDRVVHDLPLEGRHRLQCRLLAGLLRPGRPSPQPVARAGSACPPGGHRCRASAANARRSRGRPRAG